MTNYTQINQFHHERERHLRRPPKGLHSPKRSRWRHQHGRQVLWLGDALRRKERSKTPCRSRAGPMLNLIVLIAIIGLLAQI